MANTVLTNSTVSAQGAAAVNPSDAADLAAKPTRGIMVSGSGNVAVTFADGSTVTLSGLQSGVVYPFSVNRVLATNTTATGIIALY